MPGTSVEVTGGGTRALEPGSGSAVFSWSLGPGSSAY